MKELLLQGYTISMPHKTNPKAWLGDVSIRIFSGGCGIAPKVCIMGNEHKDFKLDELDDAIAYYESLIYSKNNMWYKMPEAIRTVAQHDPSIDLDDEDDFENVNAVRIGLVMNS